MGSIRLDRHARHGGTRLLVGPLLVVCGLVLAACSSPGAPGVASLGSTTTTTAAPASSAGGLFVGVQRMYEDDLKFAGCMQSHGLPSFPEPVLHDGAHGENLAFNQGFDSDSAAYKQAFATCKHDLPNDGGPPTAAQLAAISAELLKYSQCMRSHGVPGFPDPVVSSREIGFSVKGVDPNSASFKGAQSACKALLPGGGP